jgi:hypothetical protein
MEALLSAVLRGEATSWPSTGDDAAPRFLEAAGRHGVLPLVARQLRRGILTKAPEIVQEALARGAVRQAAVEQRLAAEARRVMEALADAGVPSLLMKGTALAYTHYPHPCLRPRADTDLLVQRGDVATASRMLETLDYEALNVAQGELVLHQRSYARTDRLGVRHIYDVHWKIAAPKIVADLVRWDELHARARPVPALGDHARALGDAHALLLACVHRLAHHYDSDSLIWLYDIHLLAASLDETQVRQFMRLTAAEAAGSMCARSLALAHERFGTALPAELASLVDSGSSRTRVGSGLSRTLQRADDPAGRFHRRTRMIDVLVSDLKALPGWRQRLRLLREHLFPPADYMRRRYGGFGTRHRTFGIDWLLLPALYAHRCVTGAWKWLQPVAK